MSAGKTGFSGWSVVAGVLVALTLCGTSLAASTFGVLTARWSAAFGWRQADLSGALSAFLVCALLAVPFAGRAVDCFGSRRVAAVGIVAFAALIASGALIQNSVAQVYVFYGAMGLVGAFTNPIIYLRTLSLWFDRRRGLALGIAVSGQGIGAAVLPWLTQRLIQTLDWRLTLLVLAGVLVVVILPTVILLVRDDPAQVGQFADGDPAPDTAGTAHRSTLGLTMDEALRNRAFWLILAIFALVGFTNYAVLGNMIHLLTKASSLTLAQAAMIQSISGLSLLAARVIFGMLMDRYHAPYVGAAGVLMAVAGSWLLLALPGMGLVAVLAAVLLGAAAGAETDLLTFLVGRYFGPRALSQIYSWHNVAFLLGAALGPPVFALALAGAGGALIPIIGLMVVNGVAAGLLVVLGPYPTWSRAAH
ncbi:MFS family permease [Brevundimonas vesicularis]|uniref:MFS transporter n=1 Tax=Brevundimonas vesicularis TaxID=41276 RepID=UPI0018ED3FCE|nr:MFS transporter [Brevundimonas vesicularis]MDQ1193845.1 MFS family permease [Brevundimonas vesicularis]